jgi:DNA modification methylase
MRRPMQNNSGAGQAVYDPFLGSGTTLIAAETVGRVCFGMELEPRFVDVAVRRWEAFTGKDARRLSDNKPFKIAAAEDAVTEPHPDDQKPATP